MNLGVLIPQLFYDLIGRIAPGAAVMGCALILLEGRERAMLDLTRWSISEAQATPPTTLILVGNLLVSYVTGSLLGGFWFLIAPTVLGSKFRKTIEVAFREIQKVVAADDVSTAINHPSSVAFMYDYIQLRCPQAGARIAKLRAEQHMTGVLIVGLPIICVAFAWLSTRGYRDVMFWVVEAQLVFAIAGAVLLARHLEERSAYALVSYYSLAAAGLTEMEDTQNASKYLGQDARETLPNLPAAEGRKIKPVRAQREDRGRKITTLTDRYISGTEVKEEHQAYRPSGDPQSLAPSVMAGPTPLDERIAEIARLQEGWFEPGSPRLDPDGLAKFGSLMNRILSEGGVPAPYIYPTPEGGAQAEWSFPHWEVSATASLASGALHLHATHLETDRSRDIETTLDADNAVDAFLEFMSEFTR